MTSPESEARLGALQGRPRCRRRCRRRRRSHRPRHNHWQHNQHNHHHHNHHNHQQHKRGGRCEPRPRKSLRASTSATSATITGTTASAITTNATTTRNPFQGLRINSGDSRHQHNLIYSFVFALRPNRGANANGCRFDGATFGRFPSNKLFLALRQVAPHPSSFFFSLGGGWFGFRLFSASGVSQRALGPPEMDSR